MCPRLKTPPEQLLEAYFKTGERACKHDRCKATEVIIPPGAAQRPGWPSPWLNSEELMWEMRGVMSAGAGGNRGRAAGVVPETAERK